MLTAHRQIMKIMNEERKPEKMKKRETRKRHDKKPHTEQKNLPMLKQN